MPKFYCSIGLWRREDSYRIQTGWQGATFGTFLLDGLKEVDPSKDTREKLTEKTIKGFSLTSISRGLEIFKRERQKVPPETPFFSGRIGPHTPNRLAVAFYPEW